MFSTDGFSVLFVVFSHLIRLGSFCDSDQGKVTLVELESVLYDKTNGDNTAFFLTKFVYFYSLVFSFDDTM